ncbi:helicase protein [Ancylostoma caninum]|uniref:DNA repair and recombination protein RAD54-like n=1 Tax=Ancylostoma caninum TaxID=29170 RepID=A0A368FXK3_ANCCA|nr:helicase protein [Ancylostoma caninum]
MIADCLLRRTAEVNQTHLPVRNEYILFCAPSPVQKSVLGALCSHVTGEPLVMIDMMRKAANHPAILYKKLSRTVIENDRVDYSHLLAAFPKNYGSRPAALADSGKLSVFVEMMASFRQHGECAVVVSNYTKTLDMIASLCSSLGLCVMRLDGQTPITDRQALVTKFNSERDPENVFLLSTRAGGVGLNLIGASRLILFDSDWNPALDLQAMARIWRDGQTRACHIYRLITAGTIDEKILHRQVKKTGLTSIINLNDQSSKSTFLDEELEDIFTMKDTQCETHDLLGCQCDGSGLLPAEFEEEPEEEISSEASTVPPTHNKEDNTSDDGAGERSIKQDEELADDAQDEASLRFQVAFLVNSYLMSMGLIRDVQPHKWMHCII